MDGLALISLAVRLASFLLWCYVVVLIVRHDQPVPGLVRRLICSVIAFGMAIFVMGGLTPFGFPVELARSISTVFAAYSAIIALAIATTDILDPPE